ncbi:MAG TPA: exodeoxyribonuclease VII small subunit [Geminicoccaceae bacterium]|nr:exodeoxyribonuclease VII small subunit [Geminicoccaceae bacterium]
MVSEESQGWNATPERAAAAGARETEGEGLPPEIAAMSFEQALAELEKIVQDLERGQLDLEAAITAYERGTQLKLHCEGKLREAQLRVEKISLAPDGRVRAEPTDLA